MSEKPIITMKDIARELGVSVATVSRALKDSPRISAAQRDRIQEFARQHRFTPNVLAESLRLSRIRPTRIIGVILPEYAHFYFASILAGIDEEATRRGYQIMVAKSDESYEREVEICRAFYEHKVCGIIVSQAKDTTRYDHFRELQESGVPLVFYDRISTGVNASRVVVDDYIGAFTAVSHLIQTGCKRIAYFGAPLTMEIAKNRYNGYRDAILRHRLEVDEELIHICDNRDAAEKLTPHLMTLRNKPDAFFAVNDDTAIGCLYTCKRMGFRIPEDVSVCGFTNGQRAIACDPPLTTVEQRGHQVGREAAEILIDHTEGRVPQEQVVKRIVRTRLVIRATTREVTP